MKNTNIIKAKDGLAKRLFGITVTSAVEKRLCLLGHDVHGHVHSLTGAKKYLRAGICEDCIQHHTYHPNEFDDTVT